MLVTCGSADSMTDIFRSSNIRDLHRLPAGKSVRRITVPSVLRTAQFLFSIRSHQGQQISSFYFFLVFLKGKTCQVDFKRQFLLSSAP